MQAVAPESPNMQASARSGMQAERFPAARFAVFAVLAGLAHATATRGPLTVAQLVCVAIVSTLASACLAAVAPGNRLVVWHHLAGVLGSAFAVSYFFSSVTTAATLDVIAPACLTMIGVGRYGCHRGACCYGRPTTRGIIYSTRRLPWSAALYRHTPLAPVQLLEALGCLIIAAGATFAVGPGRPGSAAATTIIGYCALRIITEMWRGDPDRGGLAVLNQATVTSAAAGVTITVLRATTGSLSPAEVVAITAFGAAATYRLIMLAWPTTPVGARVPAAAVRIPSSRPITWRIRK